MSDDWLVGVYRAFYPDEILQLRHKDPLLKEMANKEKELARTHAAYVNQLQCLTAEPSPDQAQRILIEAKLQEVQDSQNTHRVQQELDLAKLAPELKKTKRWPFVEQFGQTLFHGLHDSLDPSGIYPPTIIEQSILAYVWEKAESKEDFLRLALELIGCIGTEAQTWVRAKDSTSSLGRMKANWMSLRYEPSEYRAFKKSSGRTLLEHKKEELLDDPEKTAFYAYSSMIWERRDLPREVGYKQAGHRSLGLAPLRGSSQQRKYYTYSDCGETSLRNFFNIITYN